jgi:hypothetical protein
MVRHRFLLITAAIGLAAGCATVLDPGSLPTTAGGVPLTEAALAPASVHGLDPGLAGAFAAAVGAAAGEGHQLTLTSGFRTAAEQQALLDAEAEERGSLREALRWVFPPDRSMHVRGLAVDVGDREAAEWLDGEGARFGLCRTLAWEWWHFEWRAGWEQARQCPGPVDDPADAPT